MLSTRIIRHDARISAARFANWEQDEQIEAAELGRRLGDDPEGTVLRLGRSSAGCDWLIGRWTLLGNGLLTADEGGPGCTWTDADLVLALDLLGLPTELRHLDDWPARLESLCMQARSGSDEAVTELRAWLRPRLPSWNAGVRRHGRGRAAAVTGPALGTGHRSRARRHAAPPL